MLWFWQSKAPYSRWGVSLIFHLAPYLIFIAVVKSIYLERMVLVTQYKQYFHVSASLIRAKDAMNEYERQTKSRY